jgi:hypothetical protein
MSYRVYIGHSPKDSELAKDLANRLDEAGIDALFTPSPDKTDNSSGMRGMIKQRVGKSDEVIILLTNNAAADYWASYEMGVANSMDKRLTPVVVNPGIERLFPMVGPKSFIKYTDLPRYISSLKRRAKAA